MLNIADLMQTLIDSSWLCIKDSILKNTTLFFTHPKSQELEYVTGIHSLKTLKMQTTILFHLHTFYLHIYTLYQPIQLCDFLQNFSVFLILRKDYLLLDWFLALLLSLKYDNYKICTCHLRFMGRLTNVHDFSFNDIFLRMDRNLGNIL